MKYADRFCLFLDVLGFRQDHIAETLVTDLRAAEQKIQSIAHLVSSLRHFESDASSAIGLDLRVTQFSDSLVVSYLDQPAQVVCGYAPSKYRVLSRLVPMLVRLAHAGFLMRGGFAYGALIHDDAGRLFGPAMICAYDLESKGAVFPRIKVAPSVVQRYPRLTMDEDTHYARDLFIDEDTDGGAYIDYLSVERLPQMFRTVEERQLFAQLSKLIDKQLDKPDPCGKVHQKYRWLAKRMHQSIERLIEQKCYASHSLEGDRAACESYWGDLRTKYDSIIVGENSDLDDCLSVTEQ